MKPKLKLLLLVGLFCSIQADEYHRDLRSRKLPQNKRPKQYFASKSQPSLLDIKVDSDEHYHPKAKSCSGNTCKAARVNQEETNPEFWYNKANEELQLALKLQKRERKIAKNVILFLGDGMGQASITTARILKGQKEGKLGAEAELSMDQSEYMGFSKTYNVDAQVPDSAGTATAYLGGVKTDLGVLGVTAAVERSMCNTSKDIDVQSILMDSHYVGKSVGIVTTTRLNHATPGAAYAHCADRYWYDDSDLPVSAVKDGCTDIASQLFQQSPKIEVLLGGGRRYFRPDYVADEEYPGENGTRKDGQDLIAKWKENMKNNGKNAKYVWNKKDFDAVDPKTIDHLWGMFDRKDMQYEVDRSSDPGGEPSLEEMTTKAIEILQENEKGFFLLVEGGRIDHAHHSGNAYRAIHEVLAFDEAIAKAREMTSKEDTLIIVTADHGHTFTFAGYPDRGVPLFGLSGSIDDPDVDSLDGKPWTPLLYGNGLGYQRGYDEDHPVFDPVDREVVTNEIASDPNYKQQTAVPRYSETHGGDDIPILATGPMSYLFHSHHEQSYIAHVMRYASCVGGVTELCDELGSTQEIQATTTEFLGHQLDKDHTQQALNAMFGLEIALLCSSIMAFIVRRRNS